MIEKEEEKMNRGAKEGGGEVPGDGAQRLRDLNPGSSPWHKHGDLVAGRLKQAAAAALTTVLAAVVAAPAALAQAQGGGGFDPQGMVRGFGEDLAWIIILAVIVGLVMAVWSKNVIMGVMVILVGGFFATLSMNPDSILSAGEYLSGRAGFGGGGE